MTAPSADDRGFATAAARFLDGVADEDDRAHLTAELNSSSARRQEFVQLARLHGALLGWRHRERTFAEPTAPRRHRLRVVAVVTGLAAAGLLAGFLLLTHDTPQVQGGQVVLADGRRLDPRTALPVGRSFIAGEPGPLVLRGADGSRLRCRAGTQLSMDDESGRRWSLQAGDLLATVARVEPGADFTVSTPHARATALGTAFRLRCQPAWSLLHVSEGHVSFATADADLVLQAGASAHASASHSLKHFAAPAALPWPSDIGDAAAWDHDPGTTITADGIRITPGTAPSDHPNRDWLGVVGAHTTAHLPLPLHITSRVHSSHPLTIGMSTIISFTTHDAAHPEAESFFYYIEASERGGDVVYDLVHSVDMPRPLVKGDRTRPLTTPETWHITLSRTHLHWSIDDTPLIETRLPRPLYGHVRIHTLVNRQATISDDVHVTFSDLRIDAASDP